MFGLAGSAKLSFINSVATLLHSSLTDIISPARAGGADGHVTTNIGRYTFNNIQLYDLWGLTTNNYSGEELSYIMKGLVPSNWDMKRVNSVTKEILEKGSQTAHEREIHCVLFFLPGCHLRPLIGQSENSD
eukprot:TRINITY_DN17594_c0_g1_i1.p1 TRINITY_DN17594_c0_g1~~TRINITY_DN17594_c0_g1_i1.p1  ORF type:complete len:131 (+),score=30.33 TRINITY_DN17594_c0_g1_i1:271-663(+)